MTYCLIATRDNTLITLPRPPPPLFMHDPWDPMTHPPAAGNGTMSPSASPSCPLNRQVPYRLPGLHYALTGTILILWHILPLRCLYSTCCTLTGAASLHADADLNWCINMCPSSPPSHYYKCAPPLPCYCLVTRPDFRGLWPTVSVSNSSSQQSRDIKRMVFLLRCHWANGRVSHFIIDALCIVLVL